MTKKNWHFYSIVGASLYQTIDNNETDVNQNPAIIEVDNPADFQILREQYDNNELFKLSLQIPALRFDDIALAWCKVRKLIDE